MFNDRWNRAAGRPALFSLVFRLNGWRTEKQLNSLSANENRCSFATYVSTNFHVPLLSSPFNIALSLLSILYPPFPFRIVIAIVVVVDYRHRHRRVVVLRKSLPKNAFARTRTVSPNLSRWSAKLFPPPAAFSSLPSCFHPFRRDCRHRRGFIGRTKRYSDSVKLKLCRYARYFLGEKSFNREIKNSFSHRRPLNFHKSLKTTTIQWYAIRSVSVAKLIAIVFREWKCLGTMRRYR